MIVIVLLSVHKAERPRRSNHFAAWTISQNAAVLHSGQGLGFALCFKKHAALVTMSIVVCKHHFPTFTICISMHYFLPFLLLPPHRGGKIDVASVLTRVQSFFQAMYNRLDLDLVLWWCSSSYFYSLNSQAGLEPTTFWSPDPQPSDQKVVGSSPAWELSQNSSKNIIITTFTSELAYSYSNI